MKHTRFWRNPRVLAAGVLILLLGVFLSFYFMWSRPDTTVILVRHAEKSDEPGNNNPNLSAAGIERAQILAQVLSNAGVTNIYATQYARTQQTVRPLAENLGLQVNEIDARNTDELAKRLKSDRPGGVMLVAGHSNSVPEIISAIGGEQPPAIPDREYDNLFVVTVSPWRGTRVLRLKYGSNSSDNAGQ